MKMKKLLCLVLAIFTLSSAVACNPQENNSDNSSNPIGGTQNPGETVVTTNYEDGIVNANDYFGKENGYFVENNKSEYSIVTAENAPANVENAANQIRSYIHLLTGALLPIVTDAGKSYSTTDKVISVGDTVYKTGSNVTAEVDYSTLKTGGYVLKNYGNVYVLDSACAEGVVYAAYEFLRAFFKVEFLTYDYSYLEEADSVKAYEVNYVTVPDFAVRDYYAYSVWYQGVGFGAKLGLNSPSYKSTEAIYGTKDYYAYYAYYYENADGTRSFGAREGHTIESLLYTDAYREGYRSSYKEMPTNGQYPLLNSNLPINYLPEHPEWFALTPSDPRTGKGGRSQEEVCYTNGLDEEGNWIEQPDDVAFEDMTLVTKMIQIIKNMILEETSEAATYLMLGHADFGDECICENCKKAMQKVKTFGGMTARWVNTIAKNINKWMEEENIEREVKFVMFAYDKSINAPVNWNENRTDCEIPDPSLILEDNIVIKMAYRNCVYHSLWDTSCEQNDILRENFIAWSKISNGGFAIWDYTAVFDDYLFYLPNFGAIKDNYKYYQEIGVVHLLSQGVPGEYNFYDAQLHQWVSAKLMWETDQDVNALIQKFNDLYFGKYASYVNTYIDMFENYFAIKEGFHAATYGALDFTSPTTYNLVMLKKTIAVIQEAIDLVWADTTLTQEQKELYDHNLRAVQVTPQYMILDMNMIVDEKEKLALAVDFFYNIDLLKLTYRQEGSSAKNSFEQMKSSFGLS